MIHVDKLKVKCEISEVVVSLHVASVVDRGFESRR
jgi:hypothetical protein